MKNNFLNEETLWLNFGQKNNLNAEQLNQFKKYYSFLKEVNKIHNLTSNTNLDFVINYHFNDSLALANAIDLKDVNSIADIGSGGGFPGIPLKIKYPHLKLTLIEIVNKKIYFLEQVIESLRLSDVQISEMDWRTFLRKTDYKIDIFCARASLQPEELIRAFKPSSPYKNSTVIYWASESWAAGSEVEQYVKNVFAYSIDSKKRRLVFLKA